MAYRPTHLRSGETAAELRSQQFHYPFDVYGPACAAGRGTGSRRRNHSRTGPRSSGHCAASLLGAVFSGVSKRALAVVSAEQGDGKTYLVSNLAVIFSQFAGRTLLIDANLRHPGLHRLLGSEMRCGFEQPARR